MSNPDPTRDDAAPEGSAEAIMQGAVDALHAAARSAGLECDLRVVRDALERAVRAHPGDWASTWTLRIQDAAVVTQMQCHAGTQPAREVINLPRAGAPVLVYSPARHPAECWVLLSDRRLRKVLAGSDLDSKEWKSPRQLIRELGLPNKRAPLTFLALQAAAPCAPAARDHGHPWESRHASAQARHDDDGHDEHHDDHGLPPLQRLLGLLRLETRDLWIITVFAIGVGILSLATPITVELLVNTIAFGSLLQPVIVLTLVLFICLAFMVGMQLIQTYVVEIMQRRIFVRCLADLAYRLPRVEPSAYDGKYGPELVNRFLDVAIFQKTLGVLLLDGLIVVLQTLIGMAVLAAYHPLLLGYDVFLLVLISGIIFILGRGAVATAIHESAAKYDAVAWLEELARQPATIKAGGGPEFAMSTADHLARRYLRARSNHFRILLRQIVAAYGLQVISSTVLLGLGGWLVIQRELTLGQLVAAELIVGNIARSFAKFGKYVESYYDLMAATNKLGHLFDLPTERVTGELLPATARGVAIKMSLVEFHYGHGPELFGGLEAEIVPQDRVALTGDSGSGKSTLLQLVYGMRAASRGFIQIDGIDIRQLKLPALRQQIALVQKLDLVAGTILENIRWGRGDVTVADVNEALAAVGLLETILHMPKGLDTRITPEGGPLSSGQARAITFARAIAGKPRLLLVDGALDELDGELRERVTTTVFDPSAPWTLIIVTNDDSIRQRCGKLLQLLPSGADQNAVLSG